LYIVLQKRSVQIGAVLKLVANVSGAERLELVANVVNYGFLWIPLQLQEPGVYVLVDPNGGGKGRRYVLCWR
jgi:hypothetical protein